MSRIVGGMYLDEGQIEVRFTIQNVGSDDLEVSHKTVLNLKQVDRMFFVSSPHGHERGQGRTVVEAVTMYLNQRCAEREKRAREEGAQ